MGLNNDIKLKINNKDYTDFLLKDDILIKYEQGNPVVSFSLLFSKYNKINLQSFIDAKVEFLNIRANNNTISNTLNIISEYSISNIDLLYYKVIFDTITYDSILDRRTIYGNIFLINGQSKYNTMPKILNRMKQINKKLTIEDNLSIQEKESLKKEYELLDYEYKKAFKDKRLNPIKSIKCSDIIIDHWNKVLKQENIILGTIDEGVELYEEDIENFDISTSRDILKTLSDISGYDYWLDGNILNFTNKKDKIKENTMILINNESTFKLISKKSNYSNYANKIFITGGISYDNIDNYEEKSFIDGDYKISYSLNMMDNIKVTVEHLIEELKYRKITMGTGVRGNRVVNDKIHTIKDATIMGKELLNDSISNKDELIIELPFVDLQIGTFLFVDLPELNINNYMVITDIEVKNEYISTVLTLKTYTNNNNKNKYNYKNINSIRYDDEINDNIVVIKDNKFNDLLYNINNDLYTAKKDLTQLNTTLNNGSMGLGDHILIKKTKKINTVNKYVFYVKDDYFNENEIERGPFYSTQEIINSNGKYVIIKGFTNDYTDANIRTIKNAPFNFFDDLEQMRMDLLTNNIKIVEIGNIAFYHFKFSEARVFINLKELIKIGKEAFIRCNFTGDFKDLPKLQRIGKKAFMVCNFTGDFKDFPKLEEIGDDAFYNSKFNGVFENLPELQKIDDNAFRYSNFTGDFKDLPKLQRIGKKAFMVCNFTGDFKDFPKLEEIGDDAFNNNNFNGVFENLPKLKIINDYAFSDCSFIGDFKDFIKLKKIGSAAFYNSKFNGVFENLPELQKIDDNAFRYSNFTGDFKDFNNLDSIEMFAFLGSKMDVYVNTLFWKDNDGRTYRTYIHHKAFGSKNNIIE